MVNTQRDKVYAERRRALLTSDLTPLIIEYAEKTADDILEVWRLRMLMIFYSAFLLFCVWRSCEGLARSGRGWWRLVEAGGCIVWAVVRICRKGYRRGWRGLA